MKRKVKILTIAKAMEKTGVSSVMFAYYDNIDKKRFKIDFVTGNVYEDDYKRRIEENGDSFYIIPDRDKRLIRYIRHLSKLIKKERYDIVHIHGNSTMIFPELIAAQIGGAKVRIAHSHNTMCNHPKLELFFRPIFNAFYTDGIACSEDAGKWMFKHRPFTVINNGIDTSKFAFNKDKRVEIRSKLGIGNEIVIGHVGYFNYQKNHDKIIDVFQEVHRMNQTAKLLLVGDGPEKRRVKDRVKNLALEDFVIFYGQSSCVEDLLNIMDVFILPSHFEGLGIVLIEAQANGLNCVVSSVVPKESDVSCTEEFIGLEIENTEWAEKVLFRAQENNTMEKRISASKNNIRCICQKKYDKDLIIKKLEKFYYDILNIREEGK